MYWAKSVEEFCRNILIENQKYFSEILNKASYKEYLTKMLNDFTGNVKLKTILIKTSVTGNRNKNHEINDFILEHVFLTLRKINSSVKIFLCDGPAYVDSFENECKRLGWYEIAKKYKVEIVDLNYDEYKMMDSIPVSKLWLSADKVINISKAKTHKRFGVTLSSKNLLGVLPGKILGYPKFNNGHEKILSIINMLVNNSAKSLNIIDGINGIEGNGPMEGDANKSNFVVIGENPYNCDILATIEMGFHPAATIGTIRPFGNKYDDETYFNSIYQLRKTNVNFIPNWKHSWMYKSLYMRNKRLEKIYQILLREISKYF
ncbi:MAG: DUF362 domain-containing protein [Clostridiales bacterium]